MPLGITPARGNWEYRLSAITDSSQGQFQKGDLVGLDHARLASLHTSSNFSNLLGVATHDSLDSLPTGYATLAIPRAGCTAFIDSMTSEAASGLSFGQAVSIISRGGRTSMLSLLATSVWSRVATIVGPIQSADSRIEVAFISNALTYYSTSSLTIGA
jgi:hypothetical protein